MGKGEGLCWCKYFAKWLEFLHSLNESQSPHTIKYEDFLNFIVNIYCCIYEYYYENRDENIKFKYDNKNLVNEYYKEKNSTKIDINLFIDYFKEKYTYPMCSSDIHNLMKKFNECIEKYIKKDIQLKDLKNRTL